MPQLAEAAQRDLAVPDAVKTAFGLAARLHHWYIVLPEEWAQLAQADLKAAVLDSHRSLDHYYATAVAQLIGPALAAASSTVGHLRTERRPGAFENWVPFYRERQTAARQRLAAIGLKRLTVRPGDAFAPGHVDMSNEPNLVTDDPSLDGRVAEVTNGRGGWLLNGQVLVPAQARAYRLA